MSDKPISKGDVVAVVRPTHCCGIEDALGFTFTVSSVTHSTRRCIYCGTIFTTLTAQCSEGKFKGLSCVISRLKRFDPDLLKDDIPTGEELHV